MATRIGSQTPTRLIAPEPLGFDTLDGQDATEFAARFGLYLDDWQDTTNCAWLRRDTGGRWCADTWGISVARQNGKNGGVEAVELYLLVVLGLSILHTAHEAKTAAKHFRRMRAFFGEKPSDPNARFPELNRLVLEVRKTNGQESIVLSNGAVIEFGTRTGGAGRGSTFDVLVFDEAQEMTDEHLEAVLFAVSAAPSGDPVSIWMGTPPTDAALADGGKGAPFLRVRNSAIDGTNARTAWVEFSLDVDIESMTDAEVVKLVADDENLYLTNPALGTRINYDTVDGERTKASPRSFCRERLNIWPVPLKDATSALPSETWRALGLEDVPAEWPLAAVGLDMDSTTGRLWVAPVAWSDDGLHVELAAGDLMSEGTQHAVDLLHNQVRWRLPVVIPYDSPAVVLQAPLTAKKVKVYVLSAREMAQATAAFRAGIKERTLSHHNDPVLDLAIVEAREEPLRNSPGQARFKRSGTLNAAPLYAAAGAAFGAVRWGRRRKPTTQTRNRTGGVM